MVYYIVSGLLLMFFWCPCMAINVNVQYNGGFLPDILLWTQCYLHRGTCLNAMKRFCICSLLIPPKRFDIFSPITGGCSEGLGMVWFFFKYSFPSYSRRQSVVHQPSREVMPLSHPILSEEKD